MNVTKTLMFCLIATLFIGCSGSGGSYQVTGDSSGSASIRGVKFDVKSPPTNLAVAVNTNDAGDAHVFGDGVDIRLDGMTLLISLVAPHAEDTFLNFGAVKKGDAVVISDGTVTVNGTTRKGQPR